MSKSWGFPEKASQSADPAGMSAVSDGRRRVLRLWMVDDHASFRQGFAQLLNGTPNLRVTRQFGSIPPLLAALAEERPPDIVLLDLNIGNENGLSAIAPARELAPKVKVLMLTTFNNTYAEGEAFRLGASGFLLKIYDLEEIVRLIQESFYHPKEARLFPNLTHNSGDGGGSPKSATVAKQDGRPGFLSALRQFCRPQRRQAAR